jgi:hypothetical protein
MIRDINISVFPAPVTPNSRDKSLFKMVLNAFCWSGERFGGLISSIFGSFVSIFLYGI